MYPIRRLLQMSNLQMLSFRYKRKLVKNDPGIEGYKKLFSREELQAIEDIDVEDEVESDFMNVHQSHASYIQEDLKRKEKEKLLIRKKYFKEKLPNFLTWSDVEQIRHLHRTNPEEWTIERLSEGFPALPDVIAKVATSNWSKATEAKIKNHDSSVQKNWDLFRAGKFTNLPPRLEAHLNKFSIRNIAGHNYSTNTNKTVVKTKKPVGEFSEIIESYERLKGKDDSNILQTDASFLEVAKTESFTSGKSSKKHVTLSMLKDRLKQAAEKGQAISEEQQRMLKDLSMPKTKSQVVNLKQDDIKVAKFPPTGEVSSVLSTATKDYSHLVYPEKITIPSDKRKRGSTYKLFDCYYDDKGFFLYRVPGMVD